MLSIDEIQSVNSKRKFLGVDIDSINSSKKKTYEKASFDYLLEHSRRRLSSRSALSSIP
jgi:hypothetical protein